MRSPVIQYRIFTLMLITACVALMAAMNLLLSPLEWIAFVLHSVADASRSSGALLITLAVLIVFALAVKGLITLSSLASRKMARWFADRPGSRRAITLSRWLCGSANTATAIADHCLQLHQREKYEECIAVLNLAIDVDPSQAALWHNRSACHYAMRNMQAAIDDASQALLRNPGLIESRLFRAYAYISKQDWQAALADLTIVPGSGSEDAPHTMWRGRCNEELGRWEQARDGYRLALQRDPENVAAMCCLARICNACPVDEFRDGAEAIVLATKACKRSEFKDWVSLSVLASSYAEYGDFNTALIYARRALELAPAEEKSERAQFIEQFERGVPYRLPLAVTSVEQ